MTNCKHRKWNVIPKCLNDDAKESLYLLFWPIPLKRIISKEPIRESHFASLLLTTNVEINCSSSGIKWRTWSFHLRGLHSCLSPAATRRVRTSSPESSAALGWFQRLLIASAHRDSQQPSQSREAIAALSDHQYSDSLKQSSFLVKFAGWFA